MPYVLNGHRWDGSANGTPASVTWSFADLNLTFSEAGYPQFDATITGSFRDLVRSAFSTWDQISGIDFVEVPDSTASEIRVGQDDIDGSGPTVGLATTWFNGSGVNFQATVEFEQSAFNNTSLFFAVALHEIGHALGLSHSSSQTDIMYPVLSNQTTLSADDIAGARAIYGTTSGTSTIAGLDTLIESSALSFTSRQTNNEGQFQGLTAAYAYLGFGVPTISGYQTLFANNNTSNFGAGPTGAVFNVENVFANSFASLYRFNGDAHTRFDALVGSGSLSSQLSIVYNNMVPVAEQSATGRAYFLSQATFYSNLASQLGLTGNGAALVGAAALANIVVHSDVGGLGDAINDLRSAINNGTAAIPGTGSVFTPIEVADGIAFDADDRPFVAAASVVDDFSPIIGSSSPDSFGV